MRDHSSLLAGCLDALRHQQRPVDDLVVVDDSPEGALSPLQGARVLQSRGTGPYAARNVGWRATSADVVLFLDARSRPKPNWSSRLMEVFEDPSVAISGSEVRVRGGASLGARAGERHQFFELHKYLSHGMWWPYLPTCNLAVRRQDLEAVGGFSAVRSGGDADLCWRILQHPGRRLEAVHETLMEWVPRDRVRDYIEQNYRYGKGHYALRRSWASVGAPAPMTEPHLHLLRRTAGITLRLGRAAARREPDGVLMHLRDAAYLAFLIGVRVADDRRRWSTVIDRRARSHSHRGVV